MNVTERNIDLIMLYKYAYSLSIIVFFSFQLYFFVTVSKFLQPFKRHALVGLVLWYI